MASANPVLNDHTTVDRNEFEQVPAVLPLEIQEHIISSGPRYPEQDRVEFLCICALVCKDWVSRSRSLLSLKVSIDTSSHSRLCHHSQSFIDLVKDPKMTLIRSVKSLYVWNYETLTVVSRYLPSVEELSISGPHLAGVAETPQQLKPSMPSVRFLSLVRWAFGSMVDFHAIFTLFPTIHSLTISIPIALNTSKDGIFQTLGVPVPGLTELTVDIEEEWDIRLLGSILVVLPGLKTLHLRAAYCPPDVAADWASQNSLTIRAEIEVSLMLYCSDRVHYPPHINNNCADFLGRLDSLELEELHLEHLEERIPLWISYCSARLKCITFTNLDGTIIDGLDGVDWKALSGSLAAAKELKDVRFVRWSHYERIPAYIQTLSVLAHPHFSLSVQMSEDPDSVKPLVV